MVLVSGMRSPIFKWYLSAVSLPRMQAVWSASNAAYWASGILASPKRGRSSVGSSANWAKLICSSPLYLPPNQLKGETATTPGNLSMIARCRAGSNAAIEILLRTTTRNAAPMSSGGTVTSRNATNNVTSRNKLTATLRIDNVARRLLRNPFFRMKEPTVMESKQGREVILQKDQSSGARLQPQLYNGGHRSLPSRNAHPRPIGWGEGRGEGPFLISPCNCKAVTVTPH